VPRRLTLLLAASLLVSGAGLAVAQPRPEAPAERAERPGDRAPSKLRPARRARRIDVSFEDAQLPELVRFVARHTGRRFILSGETQQVRVTIVSERPVTAAELYDGFLSVLQMHGLTVERVGAYHRIVATEGIEGRNTPVVTEQATGPRADAFELRILRVSDRPAEEAAALLEHFSSDGGTVIADPRTGSVIVSDTRATIRRMVAILRGTRAPAAESRIHVRRLEHADAEDVAATLESARQ